MKGAGTGVIEIDGKPQAGQGVCTNIIAGQDRGRHLPSDGTGFWR